MSKSIRDIFVLTVGRVIIGVTSIVIIKLITIFLSATEVARFNIILTIGDWFGLVLLSPVGIYINRKVIEWREFGVAEKNFLKLCKYIVFVVVFSIIILFCANNFVGVGIQIKTVWLISLIVGSIVITNSNSGLFGCMNLFGHRQLFISFNILALWAGVILSILFVFKISPTAEFWLSGRLIAQAIILIFAINVFWKILKQSGSKEKIDESFTPKIVFKFAWPIVIANFLYWLHSQGYRFLFQNIAGEEALGFFVVGFGIGVSIMTTFDILFNQYYFPLFYKEISNSNDEQRTNAWNRYALAFFPAIIVFMVYVISNNQLIVKIFTGQGFHHIGYIVIWGALAESLRMMFSSACMVAHAQIELKPVLFPSMTGVIITLFGIFFLSRINPFVGSGLAIMLGWLGALIHLYINMKKLLPIKIAWKRIFYSLFLSAPLLFFIIVNGFSYKLNIFQALMILGISGIYCLFAQFILARKWLSLAFNVPFIDEFEQKLNYLYLKGYHQFHK